jgi:hypothetical protein
MGIYLDNYDTAYVVHHNVIWNCGNAIQTNKPAVNHEIYNNTAWFCTNAMGAWGNAGTTIQNQVVRNNLSNKQWNLGNTFSNNLVSSNPQFTNPAAFDFTLTASSPAIDYGMVIPGITLNYNGSSPDAGAYEFGSTPWIPGSSVVPSDISDLLEDSLVTTGYNTLILNNGIGVYPNPTNSMLFLEVGQITDFKVDLYDIHGRALLHDANIRQLNLAQFVNGLYIVLITDKASKRTYHNMVVLKK